MKAELEKELLDVSRNITESMEKAEKIFQDHSDHTEYQVWKSKRDAVISPLRDMNGYFKWLFDRR